MFVIVGFWEHSGRLGCVLPFFFLSSFFFFPFRFGYRQALVLSPKCENQRGQGKKNEVDRLNGGKLASTLHVFTIESHTLTLQALL